MALRSLRDRSLFSSLTKTGGVAALNPRLRSSDAFGIASKMSKLQRATMPPHLRSPHSALRIKTTPPDSQEKTNRSRRDRRDVRLKLRSLRDRVCCEARFRGCGHPRLLVLPCLRHEVLGLDILPEKLPSYFVLFHFPVMHPKKDSRLSPQKKIFENSYCFRDSISFRVYCSYQNEDSASQ